MTTSCVFTFDCSLPVSDGSFPRGFAANGAGGPDRHFATYWTAEAIQTTFAAEQQS